MSEPAAEKKSNTGWIIFFIVLFILAVAGVYYFFFSDDWKKRKLVKQIMEQKSGKNGADVLDPKKLMQKDIVTLQGILAGTIK